MSKGLRSEVLVLIPARAGSQRVKNKNVRALGGKPLIAWTIEAARKAKNVDRVIVTTDSPRIARIARDWGAEVPFLRPVELAKGSSTELEFHVHALNWLEENEGYEPDLIVNLYPTSPFRRSATIDRAIEQILSEPRASSLRSIRKCSEHPFKMWERKGKWIAPFVKQTKTGTQTLSYQLLPTVFIQNASIYITKPSTIHNTTSTTGPRVLPFEMDEIESVDINEPLDFFMAEQMISKMGLLKRRRT